MSLSDRIRAAARVPAASQLDPDARAYLDAAIEREALARLVHAVAAVDRAIAEVRLRSHARSIDALLDARNALVRGRGRS